MSKGVNKTVGRRVIEGLTELRDALKSGEALKKRFTVRTVELDLEELQPSKYDPEDVLLVRESVSASQAVFARLLGVAPATVEAWEQGVKPPNRMACRLLDVIRNDPRPWIKLLDRSVKEEPLSV